MPTNGQRKFLGRLKSLSQEERFCDVKIEFSDGNRKFNSLVLASLSPFFEAMLSSSMKEGLTGEVSLPTVSVEVFNAVMSYYMDGEGELDEKALYEAVDACEMMALPDLRDVCLLNMKDNLNVESCIRIWQLSQKYTEDQKLVQDAFKMILENIGKLSSQEDFLNLSKCELYGIVKTERPTFVEETSLFEAVLKWIEANEPEENYIIELIRNIRFKRISKADLLEKIFQHSEILNKNKPLHKAIQKYAVDDKENSGPSSLHKVIIVCSSSDRPILHVHAWHLGDKKWYSLSTTIPEPRKEFAASSAGSKIVVSGGKTAGEVVSETLIYDSFENKWEKGPDLNTARCRHGSVEVNGNVFVVGGTNGTFLNSIEMFNPGGNQWETVGNLATAVVNPQVMNVGQYVLSMGGYKYIIKEEECSEVQCFDVQNSSTIVTNPKLGYVRKGASDSSSIFLISRDNKSRIEHINRVLFNVHNRKLKFDPQQNEFKSKVYSGLATQFVVSDDEGYVFSHSLTRQFSLSAEEENMVVLPTIPGNVNDVCSGFKMFVGDRGLHRAST